MSKPINDKQYALSLCMIVKNEEKFLARCLESVTDIVNDMVVVDTGSTDNTINIAKRYNARVYSHQWKNDFSEAKNHAISLAHCDWMLSIR